ncbi:lysine--tRNA ligase [Eubacteriales bacterium OttesenSCG-928-M02]|nr:lysine--tRNA ligase [Eubacteriales bacterium OttesenSCG-928-M02]
MADHTKEPQSPAEAEVDISEQRRIRREKLAALQEAGKDPFLIVRYEKSHDAVTVKEDEGLMDSEVSVAGRIVSRRIMGKASFIHILDETGELQIYLKRDDIGEEAYAAFRNMDLGDIVGVTGKVFTTRTGEVSVHADGITLLSKCLVPLPEKYHGLSDPDLRYRQRYTDLIVNPEVRRLFQMRSKLVKGMRDYLDERGFMEVETPILQTEAAGANAKPFITHHNTLDLDMYLRIATELHLKRLIVGGFEKVYEIGRIFRNEGMDTRHNPEFTTIELYAAYWDMYDIMALVEGLIRYLAEMVLGEPVVTHGDVQIDLREPFRQASMAGLVQEKTGIDFYALDDKAAYEAAKAYGFLDIKPTMSRGQILNMGFEQYVEDTLIAPTFVTEYPIEISPFAKKMPDKEGITYRFELFACGRELANAFSELNDPIDQYERFLQQAKERDGGDEEANMMDEDFVLALEYGMPPTGGVGMGIDRLVMFLCEETSIRDVLLFPTMKPRV